VPDDSIRDRIADARAATENLTEKAAARLARDAKLHVRARIDLLFDAGTFVEDAKLANATADGFPADGVVTGQGLVDGRPALVMANDPTVKAGSWGARTVEKIVRLTEKAIATDLPIFWFVDSAGARITDQVQLFPGRRGAGRIFHNQVALSGRVPQICCLFGPSAAGGAYIPSFCDVVFMVEGNASMYLGSPRMAEEVINEHVTLEEMGGAPGCTRRSPDAATTSAPTTRTRSVRPATSSPTSPPRGPSRLLRSPPPNRRTRSPPNSFRPTTRRGTTFALW
jgi:acetyl-CoA carboxylase carboxyltransferase component